MYNIVKEAHSGIAYLAIFALVIAIINAVSGIASKREFVKKDRTISLIGLIFSHIQLLVGLILYFISPLGFAQLGNMSDSAVRLTSLEHPLINIIAIALITIGWSKHKRVAQDEKFKKIAIFYALGLILILSRIPYATWLS
ncbi:hypothetical protein K5I29_10200 [Flavobacterium agricola]|uniref:50S ribosomal protein L27 n=1 Tax=Flavobacterium agricola TaxID=2870839 RepID=A0ABY6LZJ2_9FLAO|nr:hypothetical protein [Flavobacterium agricola]UYW00870.1 hypothetical protein K5I29_10200 [Flavobacterium agricola]